MTSFKLFIATIAAIAALGSSSAFAGKFNEDAPFLNKKDRAVSSEKANEKSEKKETTESSQAKRPFKFHVTPRNV